MSKYFTSHILVKIFAFLFVFLLADFSLAQEAPGNIGILFGYSVPDAENTNPHGISGVVGMAHLTPTFSFGGYYLLAENEVGTKARAFDFSIHGIQGMYHMQSGKGDTFFGIRAGISKVRTLSDDGTDTDLIFSPYHFGIVSGYDYNIVSWFSVGYEGSFLQFRKSYTTENSIRYDEDAFNAISFMASVKINF